MERTASQDGFEDDGLLVFNIFFGEGFDRDVELIGQSIQTRVVEQAADYIWHSGPPIVTAVKPQNAGGPLSLDTSVVAPLAPKNLKRACISGIVEYGDNVDDEWFATWLLFQAAADNTGKGAVLQLRDSDGDFLLIEAADAGLPSWVRPECMGNRVFVAHGGKLCLVPPAKLGGLGDDDEPLSSPEVAADWIRANPEKAVASDAIQRAIAERLAGYPKRAFRNMHCALAYLPPSAAAVLSTAPQLIASAVSAFYSRDSSEVVRASRMAFFAPEEITIAAPATKEGGEAGSGSASAARRELIPALVPMSIPMTRHLFAMLIQQRFLPPKAYACHMPPPPITSASTATTTAPGGAVTITTTPEEYQRYDLGLKIATGLEILMRRGRGAKVVETAAAATAKAAGQALSQSGSNAASSRVVRDSEGFKAYVSALIRRGFFEGVRTKEEREAKLQAAEAHYLTINNNSTNTNSIKAGRAGDQSDNEDAEAGESLAEIAALTATTSGGSASSTETASLLLGKLLVRLKPALLSAAVAAGSSAAAVAPPVLPFKWPPRCDRDDSTSWLWADDEEGEGEEKGGAHAAEEASVRATNAALNREMDRYLNPNTNPNPDISSSSTKAADDGGKAKRKPSPADADADNDDMEELRGLLKKLSGFVRQPADYEGAEPKEASASIISKKPTQPEKQQLKKKQGRGVAIDKEAFLREIELHLQWRAAVQRGEAPATASAAVHSDIVAYDGDGDDGADDMLSVTEVLCRRQQQQQREGSPGEEEAEDEKDGGADDDEDGDDLDDEDDGDLAFGDDEGADGELPKELLALKGVMEAMERELRLSGGADKSFLKASAGTSTEGKKRKGGDAEEEDDDDDDGSGSGMTEADMQYNLLSSLAASVGGQAGLSGPVSNILGSMGASVPSQWWKGDDDHDDTSGKANGRR